MDLSRSELFAYQDDCLIAISEGKQPRIETLVKLPPWRAVLIARVANRAGVLSEKWVDALVEEARNVGGSGTLRIDVFEELKKGL